MTCKIIFRSQMRMEEVKAKIYSCLKEDATPQWLPLVKAGNVPKNADYVLLEQEQHDVEKQFSLADHRCKAYIIILKHSKTKVNRKLRKRAFSLQERPVYFVNSTKCSREYNQLISNTSQKVDLSFTTVQQPGFLAGTLKRLKFWNYDNQKGVY